MTLNVNSINNTNNAMNNANDEQSNSAASTSSVHKRIDTTFVGQVFSPRKDSDSPGRGSPGRKSSLGARISNTKTPNIEKTQNIEKKE